MPFEPGKTKTGGRQKGTPNKITQDIALRCEEMGCDPIKILMEFALHHPEDSTRFDAAKELCQYLYPKRKAMELSNADDKGFRLVIEDYTSKDNK